MGDIDLPESPEEDQHQTRKGILGGCSKMSETWSTRTLSVPREKADEAQSGEESLAAQRQGLLAQGHELYEYRVVPMRSKLIGDKVDVSVVERLLNEWAMQGWQRQVDQRDVRLRPSRLWRDDGPHRCVRAENRGTLGRQAGLKRLL